YCHCSIACSAACIRWCHHYICRASCIVNGYCSCCEDTSVVICDCDRIRSCSQVIIYCCCSEDTAIDRISVWCYSSCYCSHCHCSIACSAACICWCNHYSCCTSCVVNSYCRRREDTS